MTLMLVINEQSRISIDVVLGKIHVERRPRVLVLDKHGRRSGDQEDAGDVDADQKEAEHPDMFPTQEG